MNGTSYLAEALERLEEGVIALNMSLTPVFANRAGRALLGMSETELPADLPVVELRSLARRAFLEGVEVEALVRPDNERSLRARALRSDEPEGVLLFVRDVTDEHRTQQLRKQFVANASHELKTPVTSVQTLAEAIQDAATGDSEAAVRFAKQISQETNRLARLINDLLDLSRVEDPASFARTEVDLSQLVTDQVKRAEEKALPRSLHVGAAIEPGVMVRGDVGQLELLVRNLLDNSLLYTQEHGRIEVTLRSVKNHAVLEVTDDGVGIPLHAQGRVFERFYRVDEDRARAGGGTGLGLAIVKNAAESHGGTVAVASVLGEGSTFTVRLPLGP